jgi:hypothetical protein
MGRRAVGVQILARGGVAVDLSPLRFNEVGAQQHGVLLPSAAQATPIGGEITLVVAHGALSWSLSYAMRFHQRSYTVNPRRIVESGEDFDVVTFAILQA